MFWYIVICGLMLYPLSIEYAGKISGRKTQRIALITSCFILGLFMALRGIGVGVDTEFYSHAFTEFSDVPLHNVFTAEIFATEDHTWSLDFEYGYRLYNKFISFFSGSPQIITICNSLLIICLLYNVIRKNSPNYLLSIWLYITLGIFQTEMNVTRNAIAILIVYNAFAFLKEKRAFFYVMCCLLAASFHKAALIFILLYWFVYCKIELPKVATMNWRKLHLQIGESCKTFARCSQERCSA